MYTSQETALKIKQIAKEKNITIKQLLDGCSLSINTISELSKGKLISYLSFAKIADYLGCSLDYLVGRTDNPSIKDNAYIAGDNNGVQTVKSGTVTIHQAPISDDTSELVELIQGLSLVQRAKVIVMIGEMKSET